MLGPLKQPCLSLAITFTGLSSETLTFLLVAKALLLSIVSLISLITEAVPSMVSFPGLSQCQLSASPQDPSISSKPVLSRQLIYYQVWLACTKKNKKNSFWNHRFCVLILRKSFPEDFVLIMMVSLLQQLILQFQSARLIIPAKQKFHFRGFSLL